MSRILFIQRAKPNPAGKDKAGNTPKPAQLLGEWVDIENIGTEGVPFNSMHLFHTQFSSTCTVTGDPVPYWSGVSDNILLPGKVVRVYTGLARDEAQMNPEDKVGRDWSAFADKDQFVLNNRCGDTIYLTWRDGQSQKHQDSASYDQNVPEGAVLVRSVSKLVQVSAGYGR